MVSMSVFFGQKLSDELNPTKYIGNRNPNTLPNQRRQ